MARSSSQFQAKYIQLSLGVAAPQLIASQKVIQTGLFGGWGIMAPMLYED